MKRVSLILALALVLALAVGIAAAMAAPGEYDADADYKDNVSPNTKIDDYTAGDGTLDAQEGEKKSVKFGVTPTSPGQTQNDRSYDGTNANESDLGTEIVEGYDMSQEFKVRRAVGNQFIHGQFKTNTNACASCHMTHTAAGDALLIQNGIYNTCTACHDGTLGKLNVFDIPSYDANVEAAKFAAVGGGSFGGIFDGTQNASMHMPTGFLELAAAPGGNRAKDNDLDDDGTPDAETASWTADFSCASCHQPHGSYSDRLLAPNPANIERQAVTIADWEDTDGDGVYEAWADKDTDHNPATPDVSVQINGPWVFGESYSPGFTQTVVIDAADVGSLDLTATPMIVKAKQLNEHFSINYAKGIGTLAEDFLDGDGNVIDPPAMKIAVVPAMVVKVERGFFAADGDLANAAVTIDTTDADDTNDDYLQGLDGSIIRWSGEVMDNGGVYAVTAENYGLNGITWFCAACHTDYYADKFALPSTGNPNLNSGLEGKYTSAYRHTINRGPLDGAGEQLLVYESGESHGNTSPQLTCLGCHYAHGTEMNIMRNADDTQAITVDVNPSSAIKRYVNMGVCWKCHSQQHGDELYNSEGYWNSADVNAIKSSNDYPAIPQ